MLENFGKQYLHCWLRAWLMVCAAQAQGVFSFFNKPGQKGQQGQQGGRRTPQTNSSHAKEEDARAVNEDWGNQQVWWTSFALHQPVCGFIIIISFPMQQLYAACHAKLSVTKTSVISHKVFIDSFLSR